MLRKDNEQQNNQYRISFYKTRKQLLYTYADMQNTCKDSNSAPSNTS